MSARLQPRSTLYEQLEALPEGLTAEILNGQLYAQPRPSGAHVVTATSLADELMSPFQKGRGSLFGKDTKSRTVPPRTLSSRSPPGQRRGCVVAPGGRVLDARRSRFATLKKRAPAAEETL